MDTYAYDASLPCKNPHCKSYGHPHPNCRCYSGGGEEYAKGGQVCAQSLRHLPGCEYYAGGGEVDASKVKGHAAAHMGLTGLLKDAGKPRLQDPDKHGKVLNEIKDHWQRLQDPVDSMAEVPKTMGVRVANHMASGDHDKISDILHTHPLVGDIGKKDLKGIAVQLHDGVVSKEVNPDAYRSSVDYLGGSIKGLAKLKEKVSGIFGKTKDVEIKPNDLSRQELKNLLEEVQKSPEKLLDVAGSLGHYLPDQATEIAATAARAVSYLNSIKPKPEQLASLDEVLPPPKGAQAQYDRQLDIAESPLMILQHVKDGTLVPQDMVTLQTIYPGLYRSMSEEAYEALIERKTQGKDIPYKQRQTMSMFLGQPLDYTQTQAAMQTIMKCQTTQQAQQIAEKSKKPNTDKASAVEMKQINKVDQMGETPSESRQMDYQKH